MNFLSNLFFGNDSPPSRSSQNQTTAHRHSSSTSSRQKPVKRPTRTVPLKTEPGPRLRSPTIVRCVPPTCERDPSNKCVLPNPWNAFLRSDEAQGLTVAQRKKTYARWKNDYMAMVDNDPVAFRAALCMGKKPVKNFAMTKGSRPKVKMSDIRKYVAGLRQRLHDNDKEVVYVKECDIRPGTLEFFNKLIPTKYAGTKLTTCEIVGREMLRKCVPPSEIKYYTFQKVLGTGLHGFVFQCLYKGRELRAIKLVVLHKGGDENEFSIPVGGDKTIDSVSKASLVKEFEMHQHALRLVQMSGHFRVLNILGKLCIFQPPRFNFEFDYEIDTSDICVGVYVMESLEPREPLYRS